MNKRRQLSVEFEYEDKRGGQFDTRVMLKESPLKEELKKDIYRAIDNVLEKYKDIVDTPIFDDLINRKEQDIRKMSDYDDEFTELFGGINLEGWEKKAFKSNGKTTKGFVKIDR